MIARKVLDTEEVQERAKLIRALFPGQPLTADKIGEVLTEEQIAGFNVPGALELFDLIKITAGSLLQDQDAVAMRNALGLGWSLEPENNLSDRRVALMEKEDITLRAVQMREQNGALMLARQMDVAVQMRPDLASGIDMVELVGKMEGLSRKLSELEALERRIDAIEAISIIANKRTDVLATLLGRVLQIDGSEFGGLREIEGVFSASIESAVPRERLRSLMREAGAGIGDDLLDMVFENADTDAIADAFIQSLYGKYWGFDTVVQIMKNEDEFPSVEYPSVELKRSALAGEDSGIASLKRDMESIKADVTTLMSEYKVRKGADSFFNPNHNFGSPG